MLWTIDIFKTYSLSWWQISQLNAWLKECEIRIIGFSLCSWVYFQKRMVLHLMIWSTSTHVLFFFAQFIVKKGRVLTPHADYCLPGITRAAVSCVTWHSFFIPIYVFMLGHKYSMTLTPKLQFQLLAVLLLSIFFYLLVRAPFC